jgi:hypothetical protein
MPIFLSKEIRKMSAQPVAAEKSLFEAFKNVPDPRKPRGVRHPFHALLTLAAAAIVSGARTLSAISEFGRNHSELAGEMGFTREDLPCISTFHYLFKKVDIDAYEAALRCWIQHLCFSDSARKVVHIDGKSLRGSARQSLDCVHLLAAYCDAHNATVAQLRVDTKTNEHKAALELLKILPLKNTVVTGDAMFTQREIAHAVIDGGGDYFLTVKDNQKTLRQEIENAFGDDLFPPAETRAQRKFA